MANQMLGIVQTGKEHKRQNITSYSRNVSHSWLGCCTPRAVHAVLNSLAGKKKKAEVERMWRKATGIVKGIGLLLMRRLFTD